jgi:di/tricarboxylate transporter
MILVGQRMLPGTQGEETGGVVRRTYRCEFRVEASSNLEGKTLKQAGFAQPVGYRLLSITRGGESLDPAPDRRLQGGDLLAFSAPTDILTGLWTSIGLVPAYAGAMTTPRHRHRLVELVASPKAFAIGHSISELVRSDIPYEMMLVGLSRNGEAPEQPLGEVTVEPGDAGVVEVNDAFFYENRREIDFSLTKRLEDYRVQRVDRAVVATVITVAMVALAAFGVTSMLNAALLATMAMLATGCVTSKRVWNSLDWQTLVVLGAAVGLASAVTTSGLSQTMADLFTAIGGRSPRAALAAVFVGTIVMTNVVTNAAAASFMFPVALSLATRLGVNFMPFAIILMVGASCAFINPAGFQTNLMVQGPGGYSFIDFAKVGLPLTVIVGIVVLVLAPIVYGF